MSDRVVIIGGGITGLAAAHELHRQGADFMVLEAAERVGGKVAGGPVTGANLPFDVDMAADGFLAREPEMSDLCRELGLGDDLVSPSGAGAFMWVDGRLRAIPPSVLGAPVDLDAAASSGILSAAGAKELAERITAPVDALVGDGAVGEVLRPRIGDETFERLVDPLLGGINAGNSDSMSIASSAAALANAARRGGAFLDALKAHVEAAAAAGGGPVFHGIKGGTQRVIDALSAELGDKIRTGVPAIGLERDGGKWMVATANETVAADRVIITAPGPVTAGLVARLSPEAAALFAGLTYADAILITYVIEKEHLDDPLHGAGFLVPRDQGLLMTACSWSSSKWAHYDDGTHAIMRVSAGRIDDTRWMAMDGADVARRLEDELVTTVGLRGEPTVRATPWHQSLPQYRPGHLDRCDDIDNLLAASAPGVRVAGATMRGLGLPACVRQGRLAAHP